MKKFLVTLCAAALSTVMVNGQTRFSLYEEFSGEMCAPCAAVNPSLWTLINSNPTKVLLIKYQGPYAGAGPIYNAYKTVHDARSLYYGNNSGPSGTLNGGALGHPGNFTQSNINTASAVASPFNVTVTHTWDVAGDSLTANISVNTPAVFAPAGANLKIRVALIEHLEYCSAPGSNGEKEFHNVVREMYPNAAGTPLQNTWAVNETQNFTIRGGVPARVDKANDRAVIVVWIQNDATKEIFQVAQSTQVALPADVALTGCVAPVLACATGTTSVPTTTTLTNTGSTTLTSATVYYKLDNGAYSSTNWVGSLAPGASTSVNIPAMTITAGTHVIYDSVGMPNAVKDVNPANNVNSTKIIVRDETPTVLPISADFEGGAFFPANWTVYDYDNNGAVPLVTYSNSSNLGHNGSKYLVLFNFPYEAPGETNYVIMPQGTLPAGPNTLEFWLAHALRSGANVDALEVVYSTDCGGSWSTVWSKTGADLATAPNTPSNQVYIPAQEDWKVFNVDMSAVPAGAMIAFRGLGNGGQYMFLDDINLHSGWTTGVKNLIANNHVSLFPNPARESATLEFTLAESSKVVVNVVDAVGRTVAVISDATMQKGAQRINIPTVSLAAGVYNVTIRTEEGTLTQRLSVVK